MDTEKSALLRHRLTQVSRKLGNINISLILLLVLVVTTVATYNGVFEHSFIDYDDKRIIVDRIDTYDGFTLNNLKRIIIADYPREEPLILRDLTYLVNASIFGPLNPQGYLLGNLFLHIVVCYLIYLVSLQLYPARYYVAGFTALLFCVHPVHVESIAWISSRKDPLYAAFFLWALLEYIKYQALEAKRSRYLMFSFLLFCCALLSKASAVSFLPVILCYRFCFYRFRPIPFREIAYLLALLLATVGFIVWYTGVLQDYGIVSKGFSLERDWFVWFCTTIACLAFYIGKFLNPVNLSIVYEYPGPEIIFSRIDYLLYSFLVCSGIVAALIVTWWKKRNVPLFALLFFLCALLPYSDLVQVNIYVADRYLYLASFALCFLVSTLFGTAFSYFRKSVYLKNTVVVAGSVLLILYGMQAKTATCNWENTFTFWNNAYNVAPGRVESYSGLMGTYIQVYIKNYGNEYGSLALEEARRTGDSALERFCTSYQECPPQLAKVLTYMAEVSWQQSKTEMARGYFKAAIKADPGDHDGRFMYGSFLIEQKEYSEALYQLETVEKNADYYKDRDKLDDINRRLKPIIQQNLDG